MLSASSTPLLDSRQPHCEDWVSSSKLPYVFELLGERELTGQLIDCHYSNNEYDPSTDAEADDEDVEAADTLGITEGNLRSLDDMFTSASSSATATLIDAGTDPLVRKSVRWRLQVTESDSLGGLGLKFPITRGNELQCALRWLSLQGIELPLPDCDEGCDLATCAWINEPRRVLEERNSNTCWLHDYDQGGAVENEAKNEDQQFSCDFLLEHQLQKLSLDELVEMLRSDGCSEAGLTAAMTAKIDGHVPQDLSAERVRCRLLAAFFRASPNDAAAVDVTDDPSEMSLAELVAHLLRLGHTKLAVAQTVGYSNAQGTARLQNYTCARPDEKRRQLLNAYFPLAPRRHCVGELNLKAIVQLILKKGHTRLEIALSVGYLDARGTTRLLNGTCQDPEEKLQTLLDTYYPLGFSSKDRMD